MRIVYNNHERTTCLEELCGFNYGIIYREFMIFSGKLFGRDIDKENSFLKTLNLTYYEYKK